jgi:hypothetical protein
MCHRVISLSANLICNRIPGLTPNQQKICEQKPDALPVISNGFKLGINECQRQSKNRRWNCTSVSNGNQFGFVVFIGKCLYIEKFQIQKYLNIFKNINPFD